MDILNKISNFDNFFYGDNIYNYTDELKKLPKDIKIKLINQFIEHDFGLLLDLTYENINGFVEIFDKLYFDEFEKNIKNHEIKNVNDINLLSIKITNKPINKNIKKEFIKKLCSNIDIFLSNHLRIMSFSSLVKFIYESDRDCLLKHIKKIKNVIYERKNLFLSLYTIEELDLKDYEKLI